MVKFEGPEILGLSRLGILIRFAAARRVGGGRKALKMKSEMKNGMIGAIVGDIAGSRFQG
jgi:hypothetical protein